MRPERAAGFIDVAVFGKPGEAAARTLTRGWLVAVEGRLAHREWTGTDGGRRSAHSVIGRVEFLAAPRTNGGVPCVSEVRDVEDDEHVHAPF
jgi:single-stranded DNA-binding protein